MLDNFYIDFKIKIYNQRTSLVSVSGRRGYWAYVIGVFDKHIS